jgi:CRP-like cAMP-binding protein
MPLSQNENQLLAMLPAQEFDELRPHLHVVPLISRQVLGDFHSHVRNVYFPVSGVISFVVPLKDGEMVESGMVGRDGVVGAGPALNKSVLFSQAIVQVPGKALAINPERLREVAGRRPVVQSVLLRHEQFLLAQVHQSVACNAMHNVEQRMCRWILRMYDLAGRDVPVTHEFLAQMIGVGRPRVSIVASTLQRFGLIDCKRGCIHIRDFDGLRRTSCECHQAVRAHYQAAFGNLNLSSVRQETETSKCKPNLYLVNRKRDGA